MWCSKLKTVCVLPNIDQQVVGCYLMAILGWYLMATLSPGGPKLKTVYACQGSHLALSCPPEHQIRVVRTIKTDHFNVEKTPARS